MATKKASVRTHVKYNEINLEKLSLGNPRTTKVKVVDPKTGEESEQDNNYIPIMYSYGDDENKQIITDFKVELAKVKTEYGLNVKQSNFVNKVKAPKKSSKKKKGESSSSEDEDESAKKETEAKKEPDAEDDFAGRDISIQVKFPASDPNSALNITCFDAVYQQLATLFMPIRGKVKKSKFKDTDAEGTGFKHLLYRPIDETTNEVIEGRAPSMFLKVFYRGKGMYANKTLFTDTDGKHIDWHLLVNAEFEFIPLVHIKQFFVNAKNMLVQMEVVSAIVTDIKERNSESQQTDTMNSLKAEDPTISEAVQSRLRALAAARGVVYAGNDEPTPGSSGTIGGNPGGTTKVTEVTKPTMSGIGKKAPVRDEPLKSEVKKPAEPEPPVTKKKPVTKGSDDDEEPPVPTAPKKKPVVEPEPEAPKKKAPKEPEPEVEEDPAPPKKTNKKKPKDPEPDPEVSDEELPQMDNLKV